MRRKTPPRGLIPAPEALESRQVLTAMLGLTATNALLPFDSDRPDLAGPAIPISGLQPGEAILAVAARDATGQIYGLGSTGRIYTVDPGSGAASQVGGGPIATVLSGTDFDLAFNSQTDLIRLVSDGGMDLRIDPDTLAITVDPTLSYNPTDPGAGTTPSVVAAGYAGGSGALFAVDAKRDVLVTQGNALSSGLVGEDTGQLFTYAPLGHDVNGPVGLDFLPAGFPVLSMTQGAGPGSALYAFKNNGQVGVLTLVGNFPGSLSIRDISLRITPSTVFALTASNALISFRSDTPATLLSNRPILGLQPGETIAAIAFRPATGGLYGFGTTGRLFTINTETGAAVAVSTAPISPIFDGTNPSIDFDANTGRVVLITKGGQDLRINPDTGAVDQVGAALAYAAGDPAVGTLPAVVAGATASVPITPFVRGNVPFGIDSTRDALVTVDAPATGTVATVGPLGLDVTDDVGLDTAATDGPTLASLTLAGGTTSALYRLYPRFNFSQATATDPVPIVRIGTIGGGAIVRDLAIAPAGRLQFGAASYSVDGDASTATITVVRTGGSSGPARVTYATSDGSAVAGTNYTAVRGTIDFAEGETTKTFTIPLVPRSFLQGTRTVGLTLTADSGGAVGSIASAVLTINASTSQSQPSPIGSATFRGSATAITSVDVALVGTIDATRAADPANFVVRGVTAGRRGTTVVVPVASLAFDAATGVVHLTFGMRFAFKTYRSLQVTALGFGASGADSTVSYSVLRGTGIRYVDGDGDRVFLGVIGRGAKLVLLRRADGKAVSAWVEGKGRTVAGFVIPRRKSDRKTVIDRFATNGAKLRLPKSIQVTSSGISA